MKKLILSFAIIMLLSITSCSSPNNIRSGDYKVVEAKLMDGKSYYPYQYLLKKTSNINMESKNTMYLYHSDEKLLIGQIIKL